MSTNKRSAVECDGYCGSLARYRVDGMHLCPECRLAWMDLDDARSPEWTNDTGADRPRNDDPQTITGRMADQ